MPEKAQKVIDAFWPGPVTIVFKKRDIVPDSVSGGLDTVAVRFPSNKVARLIINASGVPVALSLIHILPAVTHMRQRQCR